MITYKTATKAQAAKSVIEKVKLEGKVVGAIYSAPDGFYYRPTGGPCGETFTTKAAVRASLEG